MTWGSKVISQKFGSRKKGRDYLNHRLTDSLCSHFRARGTWCVWELFPSLIKLLWTLQHSLDQLIGPQVTNDSFSQKTDEFSVKQDVEKFLRRVQLKAFFHDKEDDSNTSNKDTFETLQIRKSKWTPPEGQFSSLDFFLKKCRHDINKLKFNRNTKFSNLSSEEWSALKSLKKRKDIVIKAAEKGGAVDVWRADLYQKSICYTLPPTQHQFL